MGSEMFTIEIEKKRPEFVRKAEFFVVAIGLDEHHKQSGRAVQALFASRTSNLPERHKRCSCGGQAFSGINM